MTRAAVQAACPCGFTGQVWAVKVIQAGSPVYSWTCLTCGGGHVMTGYEPRVALPASS